MSFSSFIISGPSFGGGHYNCDTYLESEDTLEVKGGLTTDKIRSTWDTFETHATYLAGGSSIGGLFFSAGLVLVAEKAAIACFVSAVAFSILCLYRLFQAKIQVDCWPKTGEMLDNRKKNLKELQLADQELEELKKGTYVSPKQKLLVDRCTAYFSKIKVDVNKEVFLNKFLNNELNPLSQYFSFEQPKALTEASKIYESLAGSYQGLKEKVPDEYQHCVKMAERQRKGLGVYKKAPMQKNALVLEYWECQEEYEKEFGKVYEKQEEALATEHEKQLETLATEYEKQLETLAKEHETHKSHLAQVHENNISLIYKKKEQKRSGSLSKENQQYSTNLKHAEQKYALLINHAERKNALLIKHVNETFSSVKDLPSSKTEEPLKKDPMVSNPKQVHDYINGYLDSLESEALQKIQQQEEEFSAKLEQAQMDYFEKILQGSLQLIEAFKTQDFSHFEKIGKFSDLLKERDIKVKDINVGMTFPLLENVPFVAEKLPGTTEEEFRFYITK